MTPNVDASTHQDNNVFKIILKYFIEFIRIILVNKITQFSNVQFQKTSSIYCIVCSSTKVKSPSIAKVNNTFPQSSESKCYDTVIF